MRPGIPLMVHKRYFYAGCCFPCWLWGHGEVGLGRRGPGEGGRVLIAIFMGWAFVNSSKAQPCGRLIDKDVLNFVDDIRLGREVGKQIIL
jgi:hypothetical protein